MSAGTIFREHRIGAVEVVFVESEVPTDSVARQVSFAALHRAHLADIVLVEDESRNNHDLRRLVRLIVRRGVNDLIVELLERLPHVHLCGHQQMINGGL
jgi:hypothetical protein